VVREDTVTSTANYGVPTPGHPDSLFLVNSSSDSVRIDSVCMILHGNAGCPEVKFAVQSFHSVYQLGTDGSHRGDTMHTRFESSPQLPITVPPHDSVKLFQFVQGICLLCTSPVSSYDCVDELLLYASDGSLVSFVVIGPQASGHVLPSPKSAGPHHAVLNRGGDIYNLTGQSLDSRRASSQATLIRVP
jgi:hypothetical protein